MGYALIMIFYKRNTIQFDNMLPESNLSNDERVRKKTLTAGTCTIVTPFKDVWVCFGMGSTAACPF